MKKFISIIFAITLCLLFPWILTGCGGGGGGASSGGGAVVSSASSASVPQTEPEPESDGKNILITLSAGDGSIYAVIVGANGCPGAENKLLHTANDAVDFKDALVTQKIQILSEESKVTKSTIQEAIKEAKEHLSENGLFIFFYSGYGSNANGEGYLAPQGNMDNSDNIISGNELKNWLKDLSSDTKKYILIDSCFNGFYGAFRNNKYTRLSVSPMISKFIKAKNSNNSYSGEKFARTLLEVSNTYIMTAANETQACWESDVLENGVFTYYLCEGLGTDESTVGSADTDLDLPSTTDIYDELTPPKIITAKELSCYVPKEADNYIRGVEQNALGQHPQSYDNCAETLKIKSVSSYFMNYGRDVIITISKPDRSACAVIVGVCGSEGNGSKFASNDAFDFKDALLDNPLWQDAQVHSNSFTQITKGKIQIALSLARNKIDTDGLFIFAYSGNGGNSDGKGYLLPRGGEQNPRKRISEKELKIWLDNFLCSKKYILMEADFNSKIADSKSESVYNNDMFAEALAESLNTYVMISASGKESSLEDDRLQNSIFMYYVCEGLGEDGGIIGEADADSNNAITPRELWLYTALNVRYHASQMHNDILSQIPKSYYKNCHKSFNLKSGSCGETAGNTIITISKPDNSAYAVLVGIADYPGTENDLPFPVIEMNNFTAQLIDEGIISSTSLWKGSKVEIKENIRATKAEIKKAIINARNHIDQNGLFIFLYGGHGANDYITTYYNCSHITKEELRFWLDNFPAQSKKCILLSTCHAGSFIDKTMRADSSKTGAVFVKKFIPKFDSEKFIKSIVGSSNTYVMAACKGNELAWGTWELQSSAFVYFINQGLKAKAGLNSDGIITAEELNLYATPRVAEYIYNCNIIYEGVRQTCNPQSYDNVPGELRIK
ncbi:MAG: caspase family protein [Armatimonadota bacterium]